MHELEAQVPATLKVSSLKTTLFALEKKSSGNVTIHPDPEGKREAVRLTVSKKKNAAKKKKKRKSKSKLLKKKKSVKK